MKVLKEKRISLRSLLRRSVVILSLFALAFAGCGSSSDDNGEPGGPVTPPAGPTVVAINILQQPTSYSFQGCPPNLTGLIAEVTWSNGDVKIEYDTTKFTVTPGYCDEGGHDTNAGFDFGLALTGYSVVATQSVHIIEVVPATSIHITGKATRQDWYSDQRPDFSGLKMEIEYNNNPGTSRNYPFTSTQWGTAGFPPAPGDPQVWTKKVVDMTPAYPHMRAHANFIEDGKNKFVTAYIGGGPYLAGALPATSYSGIFTISNFYEVAGIEFDYTNPSKAAWEDYYDDDKDMFYVGTAANAGKIISAFKKSKVMFTVYYFGGKTRDIDIDEFVANNMYASNQGTNGVLGRPAGLRNDPSCGDPAYTVVPYEDVEELDLEQVLMLGFRYVPVSYLTTGTLITDFEVPVPIFVFDDSITLARVPGIGDSNVLVEGVTANTTPAITDAAGAALGVGTKMGQFAREVAKKWEITANYLNAAGKPSTRKIPVSAQMIADGYRTHCNGNFAGSFTFLLDYTDTAAFPDGTAHTGGLDTGELGRNYGLPIVYRNQPIDADEGVMVDVVGP
jgi:hypothetical protein